MSIGSPSFKNLNGPRPQWARATAKLIRGVCTTTALTGLGFDSKMIAVIAIVGLYLSEFILDLFPENKENEENPEPNKP